MGGTCSTYEKDDIYIQKIFLENLKGRAIARPGRRWEDNNRMYRRVIGWKGVVWMHLTQNRDQSAGSCEHGNEHPAFIKTGNFLTS
jgi:hypothetical protein